MKLIEENFSFKILSEHFKPPKQYLVSEWADQYRYLSQRSSAEPGKWRTDRTPYLRQIMDDLSITSPVQEVIFMKASQIGATESGNNWIGYIIDHAPAPTMLVLPTLSLAKRNSKQRVQPLIEDNERLRDKVSASKTHDSSNTILEKDFPGGTLFMTGANSAVGLRSTPAKNLLLDEYDAYPHDADGEGDPVKLVQARSRTFSKRKRFKISTPTIEGHSRVAKDYEATDQNKYLIPCPHCEAFIELVFAGLKWPENSPKNAYYECDSCQKPIENWQKTTMLAKGYWHQTKPENDDPKVKGYHLNALYSPVGWYSWGEIAADFVESKKDPEALKTFVNTVLGETWKEKSEKPDWNRLYERRDDYPIGKVPKGGLFLTCGVDVQKDRIEAEVVAWGRNKVSWSVEYFVFNGDTSEDPVWQELEKLINQFFPLAENDKITLPIKLVAVDSGYNTQIVYSWVRKFSQTKVIPVKGKDSLGLIFSRPMSVDVARSGKVLRHGLKCWNIGVNMIKSELYNYLRQDKALDGKPDNPGYCHFPQYDEAYFKMLTAEQMVIKVAKGYKTTEWQKIRERNEALDCRVYARAASAILGIDRYSEDKWKQLEAEISNQKNFLPEIQLKTTGQNIERRKSRFL